MNDPYFTKQLGIAGGAGTLGGTQGLNNIDKAADGNNDEEDDLEVELTEEEFQYAVKMTEVSIR